MTDSIESAAPDRPTTPDLAVSETAIRELAAARHRYEDVQSRARQAESDVARAKRELETAKEALQEARAARTRLKHRLAARKEPEGDETSLLEHAEERIQAGEREVARKSEDVDLYTRDAKERDDELSQASSEYSRHQQAWASSFGSLLRGTREAWIARAPNTEAELRERGSILNLLDVMIELERERAALSNYPEEGFVAAIFETLTALMDEKMTSLERISACARTVRLIEARRQQILSDDPFNRHQELDGDLRGLAERFDSQLVQLKQVEAVRQVQSAAEEASQAARSAKRAAGLAGNAVLTGHFAKYARSEYRRSYAYLVGSVVLVGLAILSPLRVALSSNPGAVGWQEALRALTSLPLLALAYYLSRESSMHSEAARRAHEIELRLETVEAFTQVLDDSRGQAVRAELGNLVYGRLDRVNPGDVNDLGHETRDALKALKALSIAIATKAAPDSKSDAPN